MYHVYACATYVSHAYGYVCLACVPSQGTCILKILNDQRTVGTLSVVIFINEQRSSFWFWFSYILQGVLTYIHTSDLYILI